VRVEQIEEQEQQHVGKIVAIESRASKEIALPVSPGFLFPFFPTTVFSWLNTVLFFGHFQVEVSKHVSTFVAANDKCGDMGQIDPISKAFIQPSAPPIAMNSLCGKGENMFAGRQL
jgi:hypothetical protein